METGGGRQKEGRERRDNVVRIPRDWFGPTDELVPLEPPAGETAAGAGELRTEPLDPNSFWDESSSAIQDVVEAPGASGCDERRRGGRGDDDSSGRRGLAARTYGADLAARTYAAARALPETIGVRKMAAAVAVAAVVGLSVVGWLLGHGSRQAGPAHIAAVSAENASLPAHPGHPAARAKLVIRRAPGRARASTTRKVRREPTTRSSTAIQVVYRSSQSTFSAPLQTGHEPGTSRTSPETSTRPANSGTTATAAVARSPASTPAFGASGALGPMSSPDG